MISPSAVIDEWLLTLAGTHKELQELQDPLMRQDVESVSCQRVDDRKSVDLVLQQRRHGVIQAATGQMEPLRLALAASCSGW